LELQMASPGNSAEKMKQLKAELQTKREELESLETKIKNADKSIKASESRLAELKGEWADKLTWARIFPATKEITALQNEINSLQAKLPPPGAKDAKGTPGEEAIAKEIAKKEDQLHELRNHQPGTMLDLGYRIDMLSALMFVMVTFIATLIHIFSIGYMADELGVQVADHQVHTADGHLHRRGRFGRFFLYLSLFCFSMLNLVLADNLFQVFISWELVGICSFLLIGFYFERTSASNAANKAFITNRVGDAGFVIGLLILWTHVGTFNFEEIFQRVRAPLEHSHGQVQLGGQIIRVNQVSSEAGKDENKYKYTILGDNTQASLETRAVLFPLEPSDHSADLKPLDKLSIGDPQPRVGHPVYGSMPYWMLVAAGLGIFLGCVGKSAQFPLQVWLPDAMEGPTPVSALIHAATMVAAGVYLVGRCFPLFTFEVLLVIAYTGAITLFVAASIALVMTDIKKVLAYSTVSQLGFMMLALGIGGWVAGLFHLITHAFFKALLFLGSGSVIYGCHHEQEMTKMGGLYPKMKITALTMLVGCLAIAGVPLFSGWYSKDAILAQAMGFVMVNKHHVLLFLLPFLTAGMTAFYMFRMWFMTFTGKPRDHHVYEHAHESPWLMTAPLIVLAFFAVTVAWGQYPWDPEGSWLEHQIHHAQPDSVMADFGVVAGVDTGPNGLIWRGGPTKHADVNVRYQAHDWHFLVGNMVLGLAVLAFCLAAAVYYLNLLDPADAKEQFPGVYAFLVNKWYFDAVYSALLVRPALAVAGWCKFFDTKVIDGAVDNTAKAAVGVSRGSGRFDNRIVDGLVNVIARACYGVGNWLRNVQTGYLRSYVVFLVVAAIGIWVILTSLLGASPVGK
ncbi:MAG TPA: proton-conducting transporter membrane subunit, partial [Gemmataceae bacterium]|nr:proton-conducting transporter membrane subunit [Gemmataceae bacterium]